MECAPDANDEVVNVACADAFSVAEPSVVEPSWKVTVPAAGPADATVAVNVTGWPDPAGFSDEATAVVVPVMREILAIKTSPDPP